MTASSLVLLPQPRRVASRPGRLALTPGRRIALLGGPAQPMLFAAQRLQAALREHARVHWPLSAVNDGPETGARLVLDPRVRDPQEYALTIDRQGLRIAAATPRGILYGVMTLEQILRQAGASLPALAVTDAPDFPNRGVMLDVSRDKVPTLKTLCELADLFASWKLNQIQLYTEHTFAYRNHREVWGESSPLTGADILAYDAYCRERGIELVPNQNSFGHMHRWLVKDRYRDLSEAPNGCMTDWGHFPEPFSLNPRDPRSLALLRELYDELLPHFSSTQFNVGCDETMDLGKDRNRAVARKIGVGRLYLEFLLKIHREVRARGRTMQFWGDIILHHPDLVKRLPRDVVAMEWGYEADHPFAKDCAQFRKAGIPFYVCPGTSTWTTITGRTRNMIENVDNAARNGLANGAIGFLNTDWGDNGHWQYLPVAYPGYAYGAATSWSFATNRRIDLATALSRHAFRDRAEVMGRLALELGDAYQALGTHYFNATGFGRAMFTNLAGIAKFKGQTAAGWRRGERALARAVAPLGRARMAIPDAALVTREFATAARTAIHACRRGHLALTGLGGRAAKRALNRDLLGIMAAHRELWHARNRPGGFRESVGRMEKARQDYLR